MTDAKSAQSETTEPTPIKLGVLGGQPVPKFLPGDIEALLDLPETAQKLFWKILGQCLDEELDSDVDKAIDGFANQHDTAGSQVAMAIRGARFMLLEAAKRNVEKHVLAGDLGILGGAKAELLREIILQKFDEAKEKVRVGVVRRALTDHGRLMEGFAFRLDQMAFSHEGTVDVPVALLTFKYWEGEERSRFTMYAELDTLRELRSALDRVIGEPETDPSKG